MAPLTRKHAAVLFIAVIFCLSAFSGESSYSPSDGDDDSSPSSSKNDAPSSSDKPTVKSYRRAKKDGPSAKVASAVSKVEKFVKKVIDKRLNDPETDDMMKQCLSTCKELYDSTIEAMNKVKDQLAEGNKGEASFDLSAITTNTGTCDDCFDEISADDPETKKFNEWLNGVASQWQ